MATMWAISGNARDLGGDDLAQLTGQVEATVEVYNDADTNTQYFSPKAIEFAADGSFSVDVPQGPDYRVVIQFTGASLEPKQVETDFFEVLADTELGSANFKQVELVAEGTAEAIAEMRTEVLDARDATLAVGSTNDTIIAGRIAASGSATQSAADKFYRVDTMNLRREVTPSGSNDTTAVAAALAAFKAGGGGRLIWPRDNWKFTGSTGLSLTSTSAPIHIEFEDGADIDATGSTATTLLTLGGAATATTGALGADATKGAESITSPFTCSAGDIIRIKSTDLFETLSNQPKGEMVEVLSVTGSGPYTVSLKGGLYDSYTASTTTLTLLQMPRVSVQGFASLRRNGSVQRMIEVAYARDLVLGGLYAEGARERLFYLNHVYGAQADRLRGRDFWYSGTGTSYGFVAAATQHLEATGLDIRGGRHAASHGGLLPCRDLKYIGGTFDNYHASGQKSFDFHGDCEDARLLGVEILNGLNSQASNLTVSASRIRSVGAVPAVEIGPARSCDYVRLLGVDVESASGQAGIDYIARNGANATTLGLFEVDATIRSGAACMEFFPSTSASTGATIDRATLRGDWYTSSISSCLSMTQATAAEVVINDLETEARRWRSDGGNTVTVIGAKTGSAKFRGRYSTGKSNGSPLSVDKFLDVAVERFELQGTNSPLRSVFTNTGVFVMRDGVVDGAASLGGVNAPSPSEALFSNVRRINTSGTPTLPARRYSHISATGNVITWGTAAPTTGAWNVGDQCANSAPAAGGPPGWVCTTAGTPGTWKAMANVAA